MNDVTKYSFEKCFENQKIYEVFSNFLESSYNLELLNFTEQISDFNLLFSQTDKKQRAKTIIERFINVDSTEEINIPGKTNKNQKKLTKNFFFFFRCN